MHTLTIPANWKGRNPYKFASIQWTQKIEAEPCGASMIKKDKDGYKVVSRKGKNLGSGYKTRAAAAKRLRQVEFFKRKKG
jgi:hypothetical protein